MNVSLTPTLEELVQAKVASGLYNNASEVVREALRLMEEQDRIKALKIEALKQALNPALASLDRGKYAKRTPDHIAANVLNKYQGD